MSDDDDHAAPDTRDNTGRDHAGRFVAGQSGNVAGRPRAAGNRSNRMSLLAVELMEADTEPVIVALISAAKGGDVAAIRLVLDRVAPLPRNRPVQFDMPAIQTAADLGAAMGAILQAVADGELTPDEGRVRRGPDRDATPHN